MTTATPASPVAPTRPAAVQAAETLRRRMLNPFWMRSFMLVKLPLAWIARVKIATLTAERCTTTVPYSWRTTNPFRSTYFAAQSMAAELSTGALAMLAVESAPAPVAYLIVGLEAEFKKKATDVVTFTCAGGDQIFAAVAAAVASGETATAQVTTHGHMPDGTEVSRFTFTWSFKRRRAAAAS